ncbi:MAG: hypothetical protein ABIJ65_06975 [Chloroflexota bacterium]
MGITSLVIGILSILGVCISLIPFLNVLNCVGLPLGLLGAILGIAALISKRGSKGMAIAGITLSSLAILVGAIRFVISLLTTGGII